MHCSEFEIHIISSLRLALSLTGLNLTSPNRFLLNACSDIALSDHRFVLVIYWLLISKASHLRLPSCAFVNLQEHLGIVLWGLNAIYWRSDIVAAHIAAVIALIASFISFATLFGLLGPGHDHRAGNVILDVDKLIWFMIHINRCVAHHSLTGFIWNSLWTVHFFVFCFLFLCDSSYRTCLIQTRRNLWSQQDIFMLNLTRLAWI